MKTFIYPCIFLCSAFLFSQERSTTRDFVNYRGLPDLMNRKVDQNEKTIEGSPYLYPTWDNESKVYFNEKAYTSNTFNYNVYAEQFEAKVFEDSVYIINPAGVDKVVLRNRVFRPYLDPELQRNSYFEEIIRSKDFLLLRKYFTKIRKAEVNALTKVPNGLPVLLQEENFYVLKGKSTQLEKITFKKSSVLDLIDKKVVREVQAYVKENRLKYNNLEDVTSILKYYNTLGKPL